MPEDASTVYLFAKRGRSDDHVRICSRHIGSGKRHACRDGGHRSRVGTAMKALPWILVALLASVLLIWHCAEQQAEDCVVRDTIIEHDTIRDSIPYPVLTYVDRYDTVYLPILVDSSDGGYVNRDSVPVIIPIEKKEYRTEDYHAIISGYNPNLDLMEVFSKTQTITVTQKPKRWGLGLQAGFGYPHGWYVGIGGSYNLWMW